MKFQIGDKVKFKFVKDCSSYAVVRYFFAEDAGIPARLIKHGNTDIDKAFYDEHFAVIKDIWNRFYMVQYKSKEDRFVCLGFEEKDLELVDINWKEELMKYE